MNESPFQPIRLFARTNLAALRFLSTQLTHGEMKVINFLMELMDRRNVIECKSSSETVTQLLCRDLSNARISVDENGYGTITTGTSLHEQRNMRKTVRKIKSLGIIIEDSHQRVRFNPFIANRESFIPFDAYGFSEIGLKPLHARGFKQWDAQDHFMQKNIPSVKRRLQGAGFASITVEQRCISTSSLVEGEEDLTPALQKRFDDLNSQIEEIKDFLRQLVLKPEIPIEERAEIKKHLELVK